MATRSAQARRHLDARFERLRPLTREARPHRGWIRAIRNALGMSSAELAARMGVSQQTVADFERTEAQDTIRLETLRRVAEALDCDLTYFLVPRMPLEHEVREQARRKAQARVAAVAHQGRLEDQLVSPADTEAQVQEEMDRLLSRRGLWADA